MCKMKSRLWRVRAIYVLLVGHAWPWVITCTPHEPATQQQTNKGRFYKSFPLKNFRIPKPSSRTKTRINHYKSKSQIKLSSHHRMCLQRHFWSFYYRNTRRNWTQWSKRSRNCRNCRRNWWWRWTVVWWKCSKFVWKSSWNCQTYQNWRWRPELWGQIVEEVFAASKTDILGVGTEGEWQFADYESARLYSQISH